MARRDLDTCPECGTEFRRGRLACPECGSDSTTGWKDEEDIQYESVEIPDTLEQLEATARKSGRGTFFVIAAVLALIAMLVFVFAW